MILRAAIALATLALCSALAVPAGAMPRTTQSAGSSRAASAIAPVAPARRGHTLPPGRRIIRIARRLVGDRYTSGGASPKTGFDCSGLTMYVYARAKIARLPHNAERQRRMRHMRRIRPGQARPGDLVFYMSGGHAYHVAIYAGHHMQYAATTPGEGVRHQIVWSKRVQYRTIWH
jgi:cell wall-associated NlpC family hydrolase